MSSMGNSHDNAQNGSENDQDSNIKHGDSCQTQTDGNKIIKSTDPAYYQETEHSQNIGNNQQGATHIDKGFSSIAALNQKLNQPFVKPATAQGSQQTSAQPLNEKQQTTQKARAKQQLEEQLAQLLSERQLKGIRIRHPNFNATKPALDPARSLTDIPDPIPRYQSALQYLLSGEVLAGNRQVSLHTKAKVQTTALAQQHTNLKHDDTSMWGLIASPELASHLELLQLGGLINLPVQFFEPVPAHTKKTHKVTTNTINTHNTDQAELIEISKRDTEWSLLAPLSEMTLLDLADIQQAYQVYPSLTRYGFAHTESDINNSTTSNRSQQYKQSRHKPLTTVSHLVTTMPEMINDTFAPNWELILYPERFDNGVDSLATDILDCSVAVHILKQCQTRQTINRRLTAQQICQHMRSYVLSQCNRQPQFEKQYRQIRLFVGHVVVAAHYLGLKVLYTSHHTNHSLTDRQGNTSNNLGQPIYFNVSSRSALIHRYPNISSYYINGWS